LIQTLEPWASSTERSAVKGMRFELRGVVLTEFRGEARDGGVLEFVRFDDALDFAVVVETRHFFFEDELRAHAALGEFPNARFVFGA
jgi:hypothetical protein